MPEDCGILNGRVIFLVLIKTNNIRQIKKTKSAIAAKIIQTAIPVPAIIKAVVGDDKNSEIL
jgi:hypothetical protein